MLNRGWTRKSVHKAAVDEGLFKGAYALFCRYLHDAEEENEQEIVVKNNKNNKKKKKNIAYDTNKENSTDNKTTKKNDKNDQNNQNDSVNDSNDVTKNKHEISKKQDPEYLRTKQFTDQALADLVGDVDNNNDNSKNNNDINLPGIKI